MQLLVEWGKGIGFNPMPGRIHGQYTYLITELPIALNALVHGQGATIAQGVGNSVGEYENFQGFEFTTIP